MILHNTINDRIALIQNRSLLFVFILLCIVNTTPASRTMYEVGQKIAYMSYATSSRVACKYIPGAFFGARLSEPKITNFNF